MARPAIFWPLRASTADLASSTLDISRYPKPLKAPVSRSVGNLQDTTDPCAPKVERISSSVTLKERLPIKRMGVGGEVGFSTRPPPLDWVLGLGAEMSTLISRPSSSVPAMAIAFLAEEESANST